MTNDTPGQDPGQPSDHNVMKAYHDALDLARTLMPQVLDLAQRFEMAGWSAHYLISEGSSEDDAVSRAAWRVDRTRVSVMSLALAQHPTLSQPAAVRDRLGIEAPPEYGRWFKAHYENIDFAIEMGRRWGAGDG